MALYFNRFPKINYSLDDNNTIILTNIIARFSLEESIKNNTLIFYDYIIKDGETPETLSYKVYGSSEKHWLILAMNDIVDPLYEWPLQYDTLNTYIDNKYMNQTGTNIVGEGLRWSKSTICKYYLVDKTYKKGELLNTMMYEVDENTYNTSENVYGTPFVLHDGNSITIDTIKESINYYDYELQLNEQKRKIKVLKPQFEPSITQEFRKVISQ